SGHRKGPGNRPAYSARPGLQSLRQTLPCARRIAAAPKAGSLFRVAAPEEFAGCLPSAFPRALGIEAEGRSAGPRPDLALGLANRSMLAIPRCPALRLTSRVE